MRSDNNSSVPAPTPNPVSAKGIPSTFLGAPPGFNASSNSNPIGKELKSRAKARLAIQARARAERELLSSIRDRSHAQCRVAEVQERGAVQGTPPTFNGGDEIHFVHNLVPPEFGLDAQDVAADDDKHSTQTDSQPLLTGLSSSPAPDGVKHAPSFRSLSNCFSEFEQRAQNGHASDHVVMHGRTRPHSYPALNSPNVSPDLCAVSIKLFKWTSNAQPLHESKLKQSVSMPILHLTPSWTSFQVSFSIPARESDTKTNVKAKPDREQEFEPEHNQKFTLDGKSPGDARAETETKVEKEVKPAFGPQSEDPGRLNKHVFESLSAAEVEPKEELQFTKVKYRRRGRKKNYKRGNNRKHNLDVKSAGQAKGETEAKSETEAQSCTALKPSTEDPERLSNYVFDLEPEAEPGHKEELPFTEVKNRRRGRGKNYKRESNRTCNLDAKLPGEAKAKTEAKSETQVQPEPEFVPKTEYPGRVNKHAFESQPKAEAEPKEELLFTEVRHRRRGLNKNYKLGSNRKCKLDLKSSVEEKVETETKVENEWRPAFEPQSEDPGRFNKRAFESKPEAEAEPAEELPFTEVKNRRRGPSKSYKRLYRGCHSESASQLVHLQSSPASVSTKKQCSSAALSQENGAHKASYLAMASEPVQPPRKAPTVNRAATCEPNVPVAKPARSPRSKLTVPPPRDLSCLLTVTREPEFALAARHLLIAPPAEVVVDGQNVGWEYGGQEMFMARGVELALDYFREKDIRAIAVLPSVMVDTRPNRRNKKLADDPDLIKRLARKGRVFFSAPKSHDDYVMLEYAIRHSADLVSNDQFSTEWKMQAPDNRAAFDQFLTDHRVPFSIINGVFIPNPEPTMLGCGEFRTLAQHPRK